MTNPAEQPASSDTVPIGIEQALIALDNLDDYARMGGVTPTGTHSVLKNFIGRVAALEAEAAVTQKQLRLTKEALASLEAERDALRKALDEAMQLQKKHYGYGSDLHMAMITWAKKHEAVAAQTGDAALSKKGPQA